MRDQRSFYPRWRGSTLFLINYLLPPAVAGMSTISNRRCGGKNRLITLMEAMKNDFVHEPADDHEGDGFA